MKPILYSIIISILLISGAYIGVAKVPSYPLQTASAQIGTIPSILPNLPNYVNPLGPDFLTLAIDLTPQLQGINLDLSNVQGVIRCDLTRPITYISSACMSDLSLLLPITEQANNSSTNQSNTFNLSENLSTSPISLSIGVVSDNLTAGDPQTVTVTATNASSGANIEGAEISSNVTDPSGNSVNQYNGTTDAKGQATFTFTIPTDAETGTFKVDVTASAPGFDKTTESTTFDVIGGFGSNFDNSTNFDNGSSSSGDGSSSSSSDGSSSSSSGNNDFTSPTVKSTDPKDNTNNVPVDTQITVTFSESMDKNSIDTGSLTLDPNIGDSPSIQSVSVSGKSAKFTVQGTSLCNNLCPNTNYLASISSNVQDQNGNFLDCSGSSGVDSLCQWNFQTGTGSVKPIPPVILIPGQGSVTSTKPVISGTVAGASLVTLKIEVFDGKTSLGTTNADSNGAWALTPKNPLSEGSHTITAVAQNTNNNQKSDSSAPVTFTVSNSPIIPAITVSPTSGIVDSPFTVKGTGFDPNTNVTIEFDGSFGTKKSDNNGAFTVTFGVPASTSGVHTVKASEGSNSASKPFTVISSIALDPTSGHVNSSVSVAGNGFDSNSTVNLKFESTALSPASTDNQGSFSSAFTVPASANGPHNVTATQGSNTASQSFTVTSSSSSIKVTSSQNATPAVSNNSSETDNASQTNVPLSPAPVNQTSSSNTSTIQNSQPPLSTPSVDNQNSANSTIVPSPQTSAKNNSSISSLNETRNTSVKNLGTPQTVTNKQAQVQEKISQATHETTSKVEKGNAKVQLLKNKIVNISPVAKDDIVTTTQNIPLNIQVMNNDNDPNKKDKLSIIGLSPPQHGRVVSNSNGTFTYIPAPLWTGTDVFEYSVTDGRGGIATSTAKVSVEPSNIKNHVPKAIAQSVSLKENTHIQILLMAKDSDKDRLSFNIFEQPTHGKIADLSSLVGSLVYIPDSNYVGHDAFKFKVNDGKDDSKESKVSIRVIADKHLQDNNKIIRLKPNLSQDNTQPAQSHNGNNTKSAEPPKSDQQKQLDQQLQKTLQNKDNNAQDNVQSQSKQDEATSSKDNVQPQPQPQDQPSQQPS